MKITLATLLAAGLLVACGDNSDNEVTDIDTPEDNEEELEDEENDTDDLEEDSEPEEETDSNDGDSGGSGSYEDQENLGIGDTGQVATTIGEYEVTLNSIEIHEEIDGEVSMFDSLIVAELTLKNIGTNTIDAEESVEALDLTNNLDASGSGDYASHYESIEGFEGEVEPGEEVTAYAVYHAYEGDKQYLRIRSGLLSSGAVDNNVIWTFDESEAE